MVKEIKNKNLFELIRNSAREIGYKTVGAYSLLAVFAVAITVTFTLSQTRQTILQHAAGGSPCQFQKSDTGTPVAFCETFDAPAGTGNRSGDLNGTLWGVSRMGDGWNFGQGMTNTWYDTQIDKCGTLITVKSPHDIAICNGQLREAVNDNGEDTVLAIYPKQPFDIAGRTGTVTFDVSADAQGNHAAWPTFFYTDQPIPAPASDNPPNMSHAQARNSFGFAIDAYGNQPDNQFIDNCENDNDTSVGEMFISRNYVLEAVPFTTLGCVKRPSVAGQTADTSRISGQLNHFEVRMSQNHVEIWGSDPGSTILKELAVADNINLPLTRGLIWMEDVHYNANKFNSQGTHTFAWDNVGFDGPVLPRDLANDAFDNNQPWNSNSATNLGWEANPTLSLSVPGISNISQAAGALLTFTFTTNYTENPFKYRLNGNSWHTEDWPYPPNQWGPTPLGIPVPLSELVPGTNTVEFDSATNGQMIFANVDIILVGAGGTVFPTGVPTPTSPVTPSPTAIQPSPNPTTAPSPTAAPSATPTPTRTPTPTPTRTPTPTPSRTPTPLPPTATNTPIPLPSATPTKTPQQKADFNGNGTVDVQDLGYLLSKYGKSDPVADIDGSGKVDLIDLSILVSFYGK